MLAAVLYICHWNSGLLDTEIDQWMKPELKAAQKFNLQQAVQTAEKHLNEQAASASQWTINLGNHRQSPFLTISWRDIQKGKGRGKRHREVLDADTGQPVSIRDTGGGQTLYRMHFLLHYLSRDVGFNIVAALTVILFLSLITGIVAHKKVFKEFFTFRPDRGNSAWLDGHKLLSVTTLPFLLMITYSGLLFAMNTIMPLVGAGSYGFDTELVAEKQAELRSRITAKPSGQPAPLANLSTMAESVAARWGAENIRSINIKNPGDNNALVVFYHHKTAPGSTKKPLLFNGVSGQPVGEHSPVNNNPLMVRSTLIDLHEGIYAGPALRWLYFLSGLLGAGMIATGAIYWEKKRYRKNEPSAPATAW